MRSRVTWTGIDSILLSLQPLLVSLAARERQGGVQQADEVGQLRVQRRL